MRKQADNGYSPRLRSPRPSSTLQSRTLSALVAVRQEFEDVHRRPEGFRVLSEEMPVPVRNSVGGRSSKRRDRPFTRRRIKDFLLYTLIGIGVVTATSLFAFHTRVEVDSFFKWLGFGVVSALVFGDTIRTNRRQWRNQRFWVLVGVFLAVQSGLGIVLLSTVTKVPTIYWGLFFPLDYGVLAAYLAFFLDVRRD
jgi:hypothetical protein